MSTSRLSKIASLALLALLVVPLIGLAHAPASQGLAPTVRPQAAPVNITYGVDVSLTTMNYHMTKFEEDPDNPLDPIPPGKDAESSGNMARAKMPAGPGEAGVALAQVGVEYDVLTGGHAWDDIKGNNVLVSVEFEYTLEAAWKSGDGSSNANLAIRPHAPGSGWVDRLGFETAETGSRTKSVTRHYLSTPEKLGDKTLVELNVQAHTSPGGTPSEARAEVKVKSISFDWEPVLVDLEFTAMEVTQGIQNLANDMPLVKDRLTVVRAYPTSATKDQTGVHAQLRGFKGFTELPGSPLPAQKRITVQSDGGDRTKLSEGFWWILPPSWRSDTVTLWAEIDPDDEFPEDDEFNNTLAEAVTFVEGKDANLLMVPVALHNNGDANQPVRIYSVSSSGFHQVLWNVRRTHPISNIKWWYLPVPEYPKDNNAARWNLSTSAGVSNLLSDLWWVNFWTTDPVSDLHYVGMVHPSINTTQGGGTTLGIGYRPGNELWAKMENINAGQPNWYVRGGMTLAHELGHNKGRRHVNCNGDEANPDPAYPWQNPNCRLAATDPEGYFGFDVYYQQWGLASPNIMSNDPAIAAPQRAYPMMGYRDPTWISPWEYCALLGVYDITCSLTFPLAAVQGEGEPAFEPPAGQDGVAASGYIAAGGLITATPSSAIIDRLFKLESAPDSALAQQARPAANPAAPAVDEYHLVQLNGSNTVLVSDTITLAAEDGDSSVQAFHELVPADAATVKVQVRQGGSVLAERSASLTPPTVELTSPNGGETLADGDEIKWTAIDADGDDLNFTLLYSPDDGATWQSVAMDITGLKYEIDSVDALPGSSTARMRVVANDGYHIGFDGSDTSFTVPGAKPLALILSPLDGGSAEPGVPVFIEGTASDIEDGPLAPEALSWHSDLDGDLGSGSELLTTDLSEGEHTLKLTAEDSDGAKGETTITFTIGSTFHRVFLPVIRR